MVEDWYRVVSGAGELMPTECPVEGFQCGTMNPVWLSTGEYVLQPRSFLHVASDNSSPGYRDTFGIKYVNKTRERILSLLFVLFYILF